MVRAGGLLIQTPRVQNPTREHFQFELTRSIRDQEQLGAGVVAIGISGDPFTIQLPRSNFLLHAGIEPATFGSTELMEFSKTVP